MCLTFERKSIPMVAWYMLSKESYMNLVISDVFPTVLILSATIPKLPSIRVHTALFAKEDQSTQHALV